MAHVREWRDTIIWPLRRWQKTLHHHNAFPNCQVSTERVLGCVYCWGLVKWCVEKIWLQLLTSCDTNFLATSLPTPNMGCDQAHRLILTAQTTCAASIITIMLWLPNPVIWGHTGNHWFVSIEYVIIDIANVIKHNNKAEIVLICAKPFPVQIQIPDRCQLYHHHSAHSSATCREWLGPQFLDLCLFRHNKFGTSACMLLKSLRMVG